MGPPMEHQMTALSSSVSAKHHPRVEKLASVLSRPLWIGLIVACSFVARLAPLRDDTQPAIFPDEYLYPATRHPLAQARASPSAGLRTLPRASRAHVYGSDLALARY